MHAWQNASVAARSFAVLSSGHRLQTAARQFDGEESTRPAVIIRTSYSCCRRCLLRQVRRAVIAHGCPMCASECHAIASEEASTSRLLLQPGLSTLAVAKAATEIVQNASDARRGRRIASRRRCRENRSQLQASEGCSSNYGHFAAQARA